MPVQKPPLSSNEKSEEEQSPPSIAADGAARTGVKEAFSVLVRVDVGQALGVPMTSVSLEAVSLLNGERDGQPLERNTWQDWSTQPLDVSFGVRGRGDMGGEQGVFICCLPWSFDY